MTSDAGRAAAGPETTEAGPYRLDELSWIELADWFRRDPRLLLPVGSCIQHGEFLPLGTDSRITSRLAHDVCRRTGILLAPLLPYGVATEEDLEYAGTAGMARKTLHRVLNELVQSWERQGLAEITLLTTNVNPRNIQALAMVMGETLRVRSIDTRAIDVRRAVDSSVDHTGTDEISLMLHLAPDLVRNGPAAAGFPAGATATKGRQLYEHLLDSIVGRLGAKDV
ncbi:MAG: creatininase family protein [Gemmatimonadota bacterium]